MDTIIVVSVATIVVILLAIFAVAMSQSQMNSDKHPVVHRIVEVPVVESWPRIHHRAHKEKIRHESEMNRVHKRSKASHVRPNVLRDLNTETIAEESK